jgi:hypothetical protein
MRTREEYLKALVYGTVSVGNVTRNKLRRQIKYKGNTYNYARAVWWLNHPEEDLTMCDEIHHIDFNSMNDEPDNLTKLTIPEHRQVHNHFIKKEHKHTDILNKALQSIEKAENKLMNVV